MRKYVKAITWFFLALIAMFVVYFVIVILKWMMVFIFIVGGITIAGLIAHWVLLRNKK